MSVLDLPHIGFVIAAYAAALIIVTLLIGAILFDHRSLRRALAAYGTRGTGLPGSEDVSQ